MAWYGIYTSSSELTSISNNTQLFANSFEVVDPSSMRLEVLNGAMTPDTQSEFVFSFCSNFFWAEMHWVWPFAARLTFSLE